MQDLKGLQLRIVAGLRRGETVVAIGAFYTKVQLCLNLPTASSMAAYANIGSGRRQADYEGLGLYLTESISLICEMWAVSSCVVVRRNNIRIVRVLVYCYLGLPIYRLLLGQFAFASSLLR